MGFKRADGGDITQVGTVSSTDTILIGQGSATKIGTIGQVIADLSIVSQNDPSFYSPESSYKVVGLGTSLTADGDATITGTSGKSAYGPLEWANAFLGQRMELVNKGSAGDTTSNINARVTADVLSENPAIVVVENGTNDLGSAASVEQTIDNSKTLFDTILEHGCILVVCCIQPREDASGWDNQERRRALAVNVWKKKYCENNENAYYCDISKYLTDGSAADGTPAEGMLRDGTHYTPKGAFRAALSLVEVLEDLVPSKDVIEYSNLRREASVTPYGIVTSNNSFAVASGGTLLDNATGTVPESYAIGHISAGEIDGSVDSSIIDHPDIWNNRRLVELCVTPGGTASATEMFTFRTETSTLPVSGSALHVAQAQVEICAWDGWKEFRLEIRDISRGTTYVDLKNEIVSAADGNLEAINKLLTLRTEEFITDSTSVRDLRLRIAVDSGASGTGKCFVHNLQLLRLNDEDAA